MRLPSVAFATRRTIARSTFIVARHSKKVKRMRRTSGLRKILMARWGSEIAMFTSGRVLWLRNFSIKSSSLIGNARRTNSQWSEGIIAYSDRQRCYVGNSLAARRRAKPRSSTRGSTSRSSPAQLSRQSKSGCAEMGKGYCSLDNLRGHDADPLNQTEI
jgi:hypothetical protein